MTGALEGDIRWLAFDAVGTLMYPDPPAAAVYHAAARRYGSRLSEAEIAVRFAAAFRDAEHGDLAACDWARPDVLTTSEENERRRWQRIVARVLDDVDDPAACFGELFAHFARPQAWRCYADVDDTLATLHRRGCRLALVSNYDDRLNAVCNGLRELRPIERRIISSHVGYRKPSAHFYTALVRAAGCKPREILVVGDDVVNDYEGARAAGLRAILLDRPGGARPPDAIADLRELLNHVT